MSEKRKLKKTNLLISEKSIELLQFRIHEEEMSVRVYLAMSIWLDSNGHKNAAKLWKKYSNEEINHAEKARQYLLALNVVPEIPQLEAPKSEFTSISDVLKTTYDFMAEITKQLNTLASHAQEEGDHMLYNLAQWYLRDQIKGHAKYQDWIDQIEAYGTDKIAMRLLDNAMKDKLKEYEENSDSDSESDED